MKKYVLPTICIDEVKFCKEGQFFFAKYKEIPLVAKVMIIKVGIKKIKVSSLSMNIFLIAGSNNQAIAEVLPATKIEKIIARIILFRCFFV